uniref:Uncharacterized protein n=1 Tax=uncultured bacterium A1Q1_fos_1870 TaxID=1256554 RepID=L7W1V5_9BACT|nr:hypothetical protein [uncultured bacterium A1Q1_fos_1870]
MQPRERCICWQPASKALIERRASDGAATPRTRPARTLGITWKQRCGRLGVPPPYSPGY